MEGEDISPTVQKCIEMVKSLSQQTKFVPFSEEGFIGDSPLLYFVHNSGGRWATVSLMRQTFDRLKSKASKMMLILCVSGHVDNWSMIPSSLFEGIPVVLLFQPTGPPSFKTQKWNQEVLSEIQKFIIQSP